MPRSRSCSDAGVRPWRVATALLVVLTGGGAIAGEEESPGSIAVVVGAASTIRGITLDGLREIYLRRQRLWPDGAPAMPVNLPVDSAVRVAFSRRVLGRAPEDLEHYWRRLYYEGVRPPPVLRTAHAVNAYVVVEPAAIGYVPLAEVDASACRVLLVIGAP